MNRKAKKTHKKHRGGGGCFGGLCSGNNTAAAEPNRPLTPEEREQYERNKERTNKFEADMKALRKAAEERMYREALEALKANASERRAQINKRRVDNKAFHLNTIESAKQKLGARNFTSIWEAKKILNDKKFAEEQLKTLNPNSFNTIKTLPEAIAAKQAEARKVENAIYKLQIEQAKGTKLPSWMKPKAWTRKAKK